MKRLLALGAIAVGAVIAFQSSEESRRRLAAAVRRRMLKRMEHMMASLPEDSPPKLIMSVLPQLRDQNDQMIRMLREQNELLREHLHTRK
jgi:hypothetical protein